MMQHLKKEVNNMKPEDLINWCELSRLLSGTRSVVTKKRMPKKYEKQVAELLAAISNWHDLSITHNVLHEISTGLESENLPNYSKLIKW